MNPADRLRSARARALERTPSARTVDSVPACVGTDQQQPVAGSLRPRAHQLVGAHQAHAHRVHQWVVGVTVLEVDLAPHSRHTDAVSVPADPGHDSLEVTPRSRQRPKTQRVQQRDRTSAHGDDIAQDASDSCRRALVRLDRGRVVMGLDLEDGSPTSPDADRAGVLARALKHGRARGRQLAQQLLRGLVGAVLRPQHAEHPELDVVGRSLECLDDDAVLVRRERDLAQAPFVDLLETQTVSTSTALCITERKSFRPSVPPSSGSAQRSG